MKTKHPLTTITKTTFLLGIIGLPGQALAGKMVQPIDVSAPPLELPLAPIVASPLIYWSDFIPR